MKGSAAKLEVDTWSSEIYTYIDFCLYVCGYREGKERIPDKPGDDENERRNQVGHGGSDGRGCLPDAREEERFKHSHPEEQRKKIRQELAISHLCVV